MASKDPEKRREEKRRYALKHKVEIAAKKAAYYLANRERFLANAKRRHEAAPAKRDEQQRRYRIRATARRSAARKAARPAIREEERRYWGGNRGRKRSKDRRGLMARYGLTPEIYDAMVRAQGRACAICGSSDPQTWGKGVLHVDHDHETGRVRALLCSHCNKILGLAYDSATVLRRAADYLDRHGAIPKSRRVALKPVAVVDLPLFDSIPLGCGWDG